MMEITVSAVSENLTAVTEMIDRLLDDAGCSMKQMNQIELAVEEAYINIASYAYPSGTGSATIRCRIEGDPSRVIICFIDQGKPYDPLGREDPDVTAGAQERGLGGLGIFLVKKLMDDVQYEYAGGENRLTLCKQLDT